MNIFILTDSTLDNLTFDVDRFGDSAVVSIESTGGVGDEGRTIHSPDDALLRL